MGPKIYKVFSYQPTKLKIGHFLLYHRLHDFYHNLSVPKQKLESSYFLYYTTNNLLPSKQKVGSSYFLLSCPRPRVSKTTEHQKLTVRRKFLLWYKRPVCEVLPLHSNKSTSNKTFPQHIAKFTYIHNIKF